MRWTLPVLLAVAALTLPLALADGSRTESQTYVVGAELFTLCGEDASVGGACFDVHRGERAVTLSAFNLAGLPEGGSWQLAHPSFPIVYASGAFCGDVGPISIPPVTPIALSVFVDGAIGATVDAACATGLPATAGTITATFS